MSGDEESKHKALIDAVRALGWDLAFYDGHLTQGMVLGQQSFILQHLDTKHTTTYIRLVPASDNNVKRRPKGVFRVIENRGFVRNDNTPSPDLKLIKGGKDVTIRPRTGPKNS